MHPNQHAETTEWLPGIFQSHVRIWPEQQQTTNVSSRSLVKSQSGKGEIAVNDQFT